MSAAAALDKELAQATRHYKAGRLRLAEGIFSSLLGAHGHDASAVASIASAAAALGEKEAALGMFRKAAALAPGFPQSHYNLGKALKSNGLLAEAMQAYRQAILLDCGMAEAHYNLGNLLSDIGLMEESVSSYLSAVTGQPANDLYWSNYLLALNYLDSMLPDKCYAQHCKWGELRESGLEGQRQPHTNNFDPNRKIVVGYVSADFRQHSVSYFFEPLLEACDRSCFRTVLYHNSTANDAVTKRLKRLADTWRPIHDKTDGEVERDIRKDGIDILVDLSGHSSNNRLALFARKPAPVQVTWLGYPNTTGLKSIDWRLTDEIADPQGGADRLNSERLCRLPHGFLCFRPPDDAPDVLVKSDQNDRVAFGSLNNFSKVSSSTLAAWADILRNLPGSMILVKGRALGHEETRRHFMARIEAQGVDPSRFELLAPTAGRPEHLATYNKIDVALDTFPYSGTATTCEALWMGTPVVTMAGPTHASRVSTSILKRLGFDELATAHPKDYVEAALSLAKDAERRRWFKQNLRDRLRKSTLLDSTLFARSVEDAYRSFWASECRRRNGGS